MESALGIPVNPISPKTIQQYAQTRQGRAFRLVGVVAAVGMVIASRALFAAADTAENCSIASTDQPDSTNDSFAAGLANPIRMLSWNIQKSQTQGWDQDLRAMGDDRDLVLIQEASIEADAPRALPQDLHQNFAAGYRSNSESTGVLTLSAVAPSAHCNFTAWEPWLGTPKATNITEYPLADSEQRLLVINLHAVNFTVGLEDFEDQVDALTPLLMRHSGPLLMAGDFNTWSEARQDHLEKFVATHQLKAVDFTPDQRTTFWDRPLDHVYLRGLRAVEAKAVPVQTSDHNPLLLTIELSE